jgi:hypothetical protein
LRHIGQPSAHRLDQPDLFGQMLRVERKKSAHIFDQGVGDQLWRTVVRTTLHYLMPHGGHGVAAKVLLDFIHQ